MNRRLYIVYNGHSSAAFCMMPQVPEIKAGERNFEKYTIPGRHGELIEDGKTKGNGTITCEFVFLGRQIMERWRRFRQILNEPNGTLTIGNTLEYFYRVVMVEYEQMDYITPEYGKVTVTFTVYPYEYAFTGTQSLLVGETDTIITNTYDLSCPVFKITAEAVVTITVNGKSVTSNVGQNVTVDTFRQITYRDNGDIVNSKISGNYEDLMLVTGNNTVKVTGAKTAQIIPNWGYLL